MPNENESSANGPLGCKANARAAGLQSEREMGCGLLKSTVTDTFTFYIVQKHF
jgi:hypothetical protein